MALLGDLGDDYAATEPTRWTRPASGTWRAVVTTVGAFLVGVLIVVGVVAGRGVAHVQDVRKAELVALVSSRMERADALAVQLEELRAQVAAAEAEGAAGLSILRARVAAAEAQAGLTKVRGPGLQLTLSDATGPCRAGAPENCRIQDADVQMAVNTLFAIGAEAVAVNGERLISTSAIRSAGRAILVNYRVLEGPYVIEAIGDPEELADQLAQSDLAIDFSVWQDAYGLGYAVSVVDELELPPFSGSIRLRSAHPPGVTE